MALLDKLISGFSPAAALKRGLQLQEGGDAKDAFAMLSKAAKAGVPEAEFRVGRCYLEGAGVPPSRIDGVRWIERAAGNGYIEAQALLATLCLHGMGPGQSQAGPGYGSGPFGGQGTPQPHLVTAGKGARRAAQGRSTEGPGG